MPADPSNLTRQPDKSNTVAHTPDGELLRIVKAVAQMQMIDAEEVGDRVVFRFALPGVQLLNPPWFIKAARKAILRAEGGQ